MLCVLRITARPLLARAIKSQILRLDPGSRLEAHSVAFKDPGVSQGRGKHAQPQLTVDYESTWIASQRYAET